MVLDHAEPGLGQWRVMPASAIGAAHAAKGEPQQDAVAVVPASACDGSSGPVAVAVADGHGHQRHFRSRRGAELAVNIATELAVTMAPAVAAEKDLEDVKKMGSSLLTPEILVRWRAAVTSDIAETPFTEEEVSAAGMSAEEISEDPFLPYGTTLLLALLSGRWMLCLQIGDGDVLAIGATGDTRTPVPTDPRLDGQRTTSLCQPDALESFRVAVLDQRREPLSALLLATDGYGNAQVDDPWQPGVGRDIHRFLHEQGADWVASNLGEWVARCASSEGSADDTTVALIVGPDRYSAAPPAAAATATAMAGTAVQATTSVPPRTQAYATTIRAPQPQQASPVRPIPRASPVPQPPSQVPSASQMAQPAPPAPTVRPASLAPPSPASARSGAGVARPRPAYLVAAAIVLVAAIGGVGAWLLAGSGGKATPPITAGTQATPPLTTLPGGVPTTVRPADASTAQKPLVQDNATIRDVNGVVIALPPGMASSAVLDDVQVGSFVAVLARDGRLYRLTPGLIAVSSPRLNSPARGLGVTAGGLVTIPGQRGAVTYTVDLQTMSVSCQPLTYEQAPLCQAMLAPGSAP